MTSSINANNIDGTYPVAGQDNDSQGFRDNFTNIKTNFQFAADEITDLENKVILRAPLVGGANLQVVNNMAGAPLIDFVAQDVAYKFLNLGTVGGSLTIDYALGQFQQLSTSAPVVLSLGTGLTNWPADGISGEITVIVNITNPAHTVTFTSGLTWTNAVGTTPTLGVQGMSVSGASAVFTAPAVGFYRFTVYTNNGGSTLTLVEANKQIQPFNNSLQVANIAASNVVSLSTTVSVFDTTTGNVATMAAGVAGQVKILAASNVAASNATITVTNAGWKSTGVGNVNLNGNGQTATLMYTNSKWYCIGTGPDATGNIALFT